ncbi:Dehydrogenase (flavoprotein) [Tropicibacter naphthalenivorans]|uniref:Putative oxidoreductasec/MT0587 n=1 Tax=Tropicibacter naphthalenivorans TaxID=441103 RepID=A0A0P1GCM0_9RHOB|nr:Putative oxidoreductasec/MT0587 [Tropicibacter naphthalenivorans]SMD03343.1 Dehydrogenase (flavoprotein) [Tropicibacter naphthalenivorans]
MEKRTEISFHAFGQDLGTNTDAPALHLAMRRDLDAALVEAALASGAVDFTGSPATVEPTEKSVATDGMILRAPLIIAADGVNSPTAKLLFGQAFARDQIGFALEVELPTRDPSRALRIDFGAADWGYGWQFPKHDGTTIGVGGVLAKNADMKAHMSAYLAKLNVPDDLTVKGQFLPFGDFRVQPGKDQVLLAGDAAGLVDPITGEGIAHALHSGELAALAATESLKLGRPDQALGLYQKSLAPIHSGLRHANRLRPLMFNERLRPTFIKSFQRSKTLRTEYLRLLAGETEYGPLMQKMALRLPGFALRALLGR